MLTTASSSKVKGWKNMNDSYTPFFTYSEQLPRMDLRFLYNQMWYSTFMELQKSDNPDHMHHVLRVFHSFLIPPLQRKITDSKNLHDWRYKLYNKIIKLERLLSDFGVVSNKYIVDIRNLLEDEKKLLLDFGSFTSIGGDTYYIPNKLPRKKYEASIGFAWIITRSLYEAGILTYKTKTMKAFSGQG